MKIDPTTKLVIMAQAAQRGEILCGRCMQMIAPADQCTCRKANKFSARKTEGLFLFELVTFDSAKEARRGAELNLLSLARQIHGLCRQTAFALNVEGQHICDYVADFSYFAGEEWQHVVEDVKSPATRKLKEYRIKKKLFEVLYSPLTITEV